jgi:phage baseplate assembly protein W
MATEYNEGFSDAQSVNNSKRDTFLYKDLNLFFSPNPVTKDVSKVTDVQAIKRSVRNLVLLNPGEKPFHPEVGTGIRASLFENFGPIQLSALRTKIEFSINKYEPRVTLQSVDFGEENQNLDNNTLSCRINFTINNVPDRLEEVDVMLQRIR